MKKFILSIFVLSLGLFPLKAAWDDGSFIGRSSFTLTNDTAVAISTAANGSSKLLGGGVFDGVVITSNSATGLITFYDSIGAAQNIIGKVSMNGTSTGAFYIPFEVRLSSGLTYTIVGNPGGVSIIYKVLQPY